MGRPDAEYVLPLHWRDDEGLGRLTAYLTDLSRTVEVTVVDSSAPELFRRHAEAWSGLVRHVPPEPWPGRNGKVRNVMTGLRAARSPLVVIADDDVRWTASTLARALELMEAVDLLVPQNVFTAWPWHARWDTGRQLLNRVWGGDYPGTLVLRRERLGAEGYDGDVLFENLELMREVRRRGGVVRRAPDLFVGREVPTARHFRSQRVRQAYDDLAQPGRLLAEASLVPMVALAGRRRPVLLAALALASTLVAETGRRRAGGAEVFPATAPFWAPLWLASGLRCGSPSGRSACGPPSACAWPVASATATADCCTRRHRRPVAGLHEPPPPPALPRRPSPRRPFSR